MPTDSSADSLISTSGIARRLRVTREWARQLVARHDFPTHAQQFGRTRVWRASDVERWIAEHRPGDAGRRTDHDVPAP